MEALIQLEKDLLESLGYDVAKFVRGKYEDVADEYSVRELEHEHETKLHEEKTPTFFLTDFPEHTSPFWNMKRGSGDTAKKVDDIMSGQETIGSADRESDKEVMLTRFKAIMNGGYEQKLFSLFGEERTMAEMDDYLNFDFFTRCGGGIGVTRLMRSMKLEGLI